jgi:hypothetical protein
MATDDTVPYYIAAPDDEDQTPSQGIASLLSPADAASLVQGNAPAPPTAVPAQAVAPAQSSAPAQVSGPAQGSAPAQPDASAQPAGQTASSVLSQVQVPTYDPNKVAALQAQAAADRTPINPNQDQYKPSKTQRVLRGISAYFSGGIPAVLSPETYDSPNRQYRIDDAQRQARLANDTAGLDAYQKGFEDQNTAAERQIGLGTAVGTAALNDAKATYNRDRAEKYSNAVDPNSMAPDDPEHPEGTWSGLSYGGDKLTGLTAPKGMSGATVTKAQMNTRSAMADSVGLKGPERQYYILTGKMRDPQQPGVKVSIPSADSQEWSDYKGSLGRAVTPDDVLSFHRNGGKGGSTEVGDTRNLISYRTQLAKERDDPMTSDDDRAALDQKVKAQDALIAAAQQSNASPKPATATAAARPARNVPSPTTHMFNLTRWKAANPKATAAQVAAATSSAKKQGYAVVGN